LERGNCKLGVFETETSTTIKKGLEDTQIYDCIAVKEVFLGKDCAGTVRPGEREKTTRGGEKEESCDEDDNTSEGKEHRIFKRSITVGARNNV